MPFNAITSASHTNAASITPTHAEGLNYVGAGAAIYDDLYMTSDPNILSNVPSAWDWNTIMWATFGGNLTAGNLQYMLENIDALRIKRRKEGDGQWLTMFEIPINEQGDLTFIRLDRYVQAGVTYEYALVPVVNSIEAEIISHSVDITFDGVFITNGETSYHTRMECAIDSYQRQHGGTSVETLARRYPYFIQNAAANYDTGHAQGIFTPLDVDGCHISLDGTFDFERDMLSFLIDGRAKILKDQFGQIWMIQVTGTPSVSDGGVPQLKLTAFDWVQIGNENSQADLYDNGLISVSPHVTGSMYVQSND